MSKRIFNGNNCIGLKRLKSILGSHSIPSWIIVSHRTNNSDDLKVRPNFLIDTQLICKRPDRLR